MVRYPADCFVYALIDPRTKLIRYIGKTVKGYVRLATHGHAHRLKQNNYCAHWLSELKAKGLEFEHTKLEFAAPQDLGKAEVWWIAYGKASGWPLTNLTEGGEGSLGRFHSEETRRRISAGLKGKKLHPDTVEKIRIKMLGNKYTLGFLHKEESKRLMSIKRKGIRKTDETRHNMSVAQLKRRRKWTDEELINAVKCSTSAREVGSKLGVSLTSTYRLRKDIERLRLDTDHFIGGRWGSGVRRQRK